MYAAQVLRLGARQVNVHTAYSIDYIHKATEIYADCTVNLQTKVFSIVSYKSEAPPNRYAALMRLSTWPGI